MDSGFINSAALEKFSPVSLSDINELNLMRRVDFKYVFPVQQINELLELAHKNYQILQILGQRIFVYKTEYLDSPDLMFYYNHHNLRYKRHKIRYRTYTNSNLTFLEIKEKTNKGFTIKERINVSGQPKFSEGHLSFINGKFLGNNPRLNVSSCNQFNRITLVSFKTRERITLDFNLSIWNNDKNARLPQLAIAEIKRDKHLIHSPIMQALKELKIQPRNFSKYCVGMAILNPQLKQNTFKPNLLYLKKLNHEYAVV